MKRLFGLFLAIASSFAHSSILPPNDIRIPVDKTAPKGITLAQFHAVIDGVESAYRPVTIQLGKTLTFERLWEDPRLNAEAQQNGDHWVVRLFGGIPRFRTMDPDAFTVVVCHELGHHLGGAPLYQSGLRIWASNEGQADYFATLKCLRRVWEGQDHRAVLAERAQDPILVEACETQWAGDQERALCVRSGRAGMVIGQMLAFATRGRISPRFGRAAPSAPSVTRDGHSSPQCRLESFFQGALCTRDWHQDLSNDSVLMGACHTENGDSVGLRPRCWYKP